MLNFGSQKNQDNFNQLAGNNPELDSLDKKNISEPAIDPTAIHVMPGKFTPQKGDKKVSSAPKTASATAPASVQSSVKKMLIFSLLFLLISGGVIAGIFWYFSQMEEPAPPSTNDQIAQVNQNQNTNTNQNIVTPEPTPPPPEPEPTPPPPEPTPPPPQPTTNIDTDNDELTYEEEMLYGTDPNNPDTDRDGYNDGMEIINLYNPLGPGLLEDSGLVSRFINDQFNYSFLKPTPWLTQAVGGNMGEIIISPSSETGEWFIFYAMANEENWTLSQARQGLAHFLPVADSLQNYNLADQSALRSLDKRTVLMIAGDYIYLLVYEKGTVATENFQTTFEMMLNSFQLLENNIEIIDISF